MALNLRNLEDELARVGGASMLDLGCDDGRRTLELARASGATELHGIEVVDAAAAQAEAAGVIVERHDLNRSPWPYPDDRFDIVVSNQVIEHVDDPDLFVAEGARVLAPGGAMIASTENLASWHNIAALLFGWQPFSLTNVSTTGLGLGNPAAAWRGHDTDRPTWTHNQVFAYRGLVELFEAHGLAVERVVGAGYHPLPARLGRRDVRHAHFLTITARKQ